MVDGRLKSPLGRAYTPHMRPLPDVPSDPVVEARLASEKAAGKTATRSLRVSIE